MSNSSIRPIDQGRVWLGSNGNKELLHISQSSSITGSSPSDLLSYLGHSLGVRGYPFARLQLVYSTAPADWAIGQVVYIKIQCKATVATFKGQLVMIWNVISKMELWHWSGGRFLFNKCQLYLKIKVGTLNRNFSSCHGLQFYMLYVNIQHCFIFVYFIRKFCSHIKEYF